MSEFVIEGHKYKASRMDAFTQFHIARRLAPVLSAAIELGRSAANSAPKADEGEANLANIIKGIMPLAEAVASLSEDDCNYVIGKCLAVVYRENSSGVGSSWAPIWSASAGRLLYDDISMPEMMQITARVIQEMLGSFMTAQPSGVTASLVPRA